MGIVYVDEIDKVCGGEGRSSSFRRATQSTFLKLMEDTEVTVGGQQRQMMMGVGEKGVKMSTRWAERGGLGHVIDHLGSEESTLEAS